MEKYPQSRKDYGPLVLLSLPEKHSPKMEEPCSSLLLTSHLAQSSPQSAILLIDLYEYHTYPRIAEIVSDVRVSVSYQPSRTFTIRGFTVLPVNQIM